MESLNLVPTGRHLGWSLNPSATASAKREAHCVDLLPAACVSPKMPCAVDVRTLNRTLAMLPVADTLARDLSGPDLFNLRHSFSNGSAARDMITYVALRRYATSEDWGPLPDTEKKGLGQAIHCLSCQLGKDDEDLLDSLRSGDETEAGDRHEITEHDLRRLVAGVAWDDPEAFVRQLLHREKAEQQEDTAVVTLLKGACLAWRSVPMAFVMLKGLQLVQKAGETVEHRLKDQNGQNLFQSRFFYEQFPPLWQRLVLAADVFAVRPEGISPLYYAVTATPDASILQTLLELGADPNQHAGPYEPALIACMQPSVKNRLQKMEALLSHPNIDPNCTRDGSPRSTSVLHIAASMPDGEMFARKLLQHPAIKRNLYSKTEDGSPLATAVLKFLTVDDYPDDTIHTLIAAGCRLSTMSVEREVVDCGYDIDQYLSVSAILNRPGVPECSMARFDENKARLKTLVEQQLARQRGPSPENCA